MLFTDIFYAYAQIVCCQTFWGAAVGKGGKTFGKSEIKVVSPPVSMF